MIKYHKNTIPSGQNLIKLGEIATKSDKVQTIPTNQEEFQPTIANSKETDRMWREWVTSLGLNPSELIRDGKKKNAKLRKKIGKLEGQLELKKKKRRKKKSKSTINSDISILKSQLDLTWDDMDIYPPNIIETSKGRVIDTDDYDWGVNEITLRQFYKLNMIGSLRVYLAIQNILSGNLHKGRKDITIDGIFYENVTGSEIIASQLGISVNSIRIHVRNLINKGFARKNTNNWISLIGWKGRCISESKGIFKFGSFKYLDEDSGEWVNNRPFSINSEKLKSKEGLRYLRSFVYSTFIHRAVQYSRKNNSKKSTHMAASWLKTSSLKNTNYTPVSTSFVIACNKLTISQRTITRHLKAADKIGEITYFNEFDILAVRNTLKEVQGLMISIKPVCPHATIKKSKKGKWLIVKYYTNSVKSNLQELGGVVM